MDAIKIKDITYYSIQRATLEYGVTKKTLYEWIKEDKMEIKTIGTVKFVRKI